MHDGVRSRHERLYPLVYAAPVESVDERRTCGHARCDVVLSRYNPSPTCTLHAGWTDGQRRRRRRAPRAQD